MDIDWILQEELPELTNEERRRVVSRLTPFIDDAVALERERCASLCRARGALWERTSLSTSTVASAVAEARFRSNEAKYLADLIESEITPG